MRELRADVPVLLMSEYSEVDLTTCRDDDGLTGFLEKLFDVLEPLEKVRDLLAS